MLNVEIEEAQSTRTCHVCKGKIPKGTKHLRITREFGYSNICNGECLMYFQKEFEKEAERVIKELKEIKAWSVDPEVIKKQEENTIERKLTSKGW